MLSSKGSIDVAAVASGAALTITWSKRFDAGLATHSRVGGQGLRLIERIVATRRGRFAIDWRDDGLAVTLAFALHPAA